VIFLPASSALRWAGEKNSLPSGSAAKTALEQLNPDRSSKSVMRFVITCFPVDGR
jgi:hypothetical protein